MLYKPHWTPHEDDDIIYAYPQGGIYQEPDPDNPDPDDPRIEPDEDSKED